MTVFMFAHRGMYTVKFGSNSLFYFEVNAGEFISDLKITDALRLPVCLQSPFC